jgi:hypothetical protein
VGKSLWTLKEDESGKCSQLKSAEVKNRCEREILGHSGIWLIVESHLSSILGF